MQVKATDRDLDVNAELSYRFSSQTGHADVFSIDPDTGHIYIRSALDYERNARYHLTAMACDGVARNQLQDKDREARPSSVDSNNISATNKVSALNTTDRQFVMWF